MKITLDTILRSVKEYFMMAIGMLLYSFGWVACIIPAGGMGGGATGLSMLLNHMVPAISIGQFVFIVNVILLIIAGFIVGWNFGIKTIYCIIILSITMDMWGMVLPENILEIYTQNIDSHNIRRYRRGDMLRAGRIHRRYRYRRNDHKQVPHRQLRTHSHRR